MKWKRSDGRLNGDGIESIGEEGMEGARERENIERRENKNENEKEKRKWG